MSSFSFTPQHDAMQCGVACLQMICQHHGQEYTIEELSDLCFATRQGVSLLGLSEAAGRLGLHTICGNVTIEMLRKAPLPCILHWNQTHFVVLYNVKRNGDFQIADPAKGLICYNEEQLFEHWISTISGGKEKGVAMFLQPTPDFKKNEKKYGKGDECRLFHFLYNYIKNYRKYFIQILLGLIVGCLLQLILPFLTQTIVDTGIRNKDIGFVWLVLLGQLMLTVSRTALDFVRRLLLLHISMRINLSLVSDFFIKLFRLPMAFFDTKLMGDILQRINDHERVEHFLTSQTLTIAFSIFSMGVFGIVLCCYNSVIFIIFLFGSIIYALWIALFLHKRKQIDYALFECMASNNNKTYEMITSMQEIKLQDCEQRRRWEWEDTQADLFAVQIKSLKLQQAQEAGSIFINELKNIIITVVAATAVIKGELTLGMMLAVQYIIGQLNSPVEQVMNFIYSLQDVKISLERINEIHLKTEEDSNSEQIVDLVKDNGNIKLNNVSFRYDKNSLKKTINDISLNIEEGKVTAIVGASGSGKTTLLKLLLGYYPVENGDIMIGNNNLNDINKRWWRRQCGVVMQDGVIFSESIARNIAVGDDEIDEQRLKEAAETACIYDMVMALPLKFNTRIGHDGMGLSQGQKQRILIARAVYKNPRYILLDEATNSLDAQNERNIVDNLERFYRGRTVIIVAHRLSTVCNADKIVVIDAGKIVEVGSHKELTELRGAYYKLVKNQLELGN